VIESIKKESGGFGIGTTFMGTEVTDEGSLHTIGGSSFAMKPVACIDTSGEDREATRDGTTMCTVIGVGTNTLVGVGGVGRNHVFFPEEGSDHRFAHQSSITPMTESIGGSCNVLVGDTWGNSAAIINGGALGTDNSFGLAAGGIYDAHVGTDTLTEHSCHNLLLLLR
jgi:hypothetical protein